jgi:hypothetical protein
VTPERTDPQNRRQKAGDEEWGNGRKGEEAENRKQKAESKRQNEVYSSHFIGSSVS